mmetsp:Transcript_10225/g.39769  ORF Transcript_10225/g.39769 Transcript_10225/m.39769 type:complete len:249 (-) Transcript_10225:204-950(-)
MASCGDMPLSLLRRSASTLLLPAALSGARGPGPCVRSLPEAVGAALAGGARLPTRGSASRAGERDARGSSWSLSSAPALLAVHDRCDERAQGSAAAVSVAADAGASAADAELAGPRGPAVAAPRAAHASLCLAARRKRSTRSGEDAASSTSPVLCRVTPAERSPRLLLKPGVASASSPSACSSKAPTPPPPPSSLLCWPSSSSSASFSSSRASSSSSLSNALTASIVPPPPPPVALPAPFAAGTASPD